MKKHFVCLANSFKYGGRCLAGIEIEFENNQKISLIRNADGRARWIRPISQSEHKELQNMEVESIKLLDIIEIDDVLPCPCCAHSENVLYSSLKNLGKTLHKTQNNLNTICGNVHSMLFFNAGNAISAEVFSGCNYSLMMVKVLDAVFCFEQGKIRVKFSHRGCGYNLPITDPVVIKYVKMNGLAKINSRHTYYFTISLSEELNGQHYKLVAGIVSMPNK
jgi:hypothetical protein